MSILILIFAILGWIFAFVFFILLLITSLAFGAAQELAKEQGQSKLNTHTKTNIKLWSMTKGNEIPFGD